MAQYWLSDPWSADPWPSFDELRRSMDDLLQSWGSRAPRRAGVTPPVNLYETEDGFVLTAELPGLGPDDVEVSVEGNRVTLRGERRISYPEQANVHRLEREAGLFRRAVQLPADVESEKAEAVFRRGVLMLRIPKAPQHKPRRISVQGG